MVVTVSVVLAIAGAVLVILGIVGGGISGQIGLPKKLSSFERTFAILGGLLLLIAAYFLDQPFGSQQTASTQQQEAQNTITALETQIAGQSRRHTDTPQISVPDETQDSTRTPQPTIKPSATATEGVAPTDEAASSTNENTSTETIEPTATLQPPTETPNPTGISSPTEAPTPTEIVEPYVVETLTIPGTAQNGIRFEAPDDGRYRVDFVEGAYDSWPPGDPSKSLWRTIIQVYANRPIEWGFRPNDDFEEPVNPDDFIGWWEDEAISSPDEAAQLAENRKPRSKVFDLQEGDYLLLVPIDQNDAYTYSANQGEVTVEIWVLSP
jgi:hypothetical protein